MGISVYDMIGNWACSPPVIYQEIQKIIEDPDSSFEDFSRVINADPNLGSQLLKLANSAYYGLSHRVDTITHALSIVGMEQLSDLVFSIVVINQFQGIPKELMNIESFWQHSLACGVAARNLAAAVDKTAAERFYLAGMLHDIGTLVVCKAKPELAAKIFETVHETGGSLCEEEVKILDFDHTAMGSVLLKGWNLPSTLVEGVAYHHQPAMAKKHPEIAAAIHVADIMAHELELGSNGEPGVPELYEPALETLRIDRDYIEGLKDTVREQTEEVFSIFRK